ncbi:hypothetical protein AAON49_12915 [Pseudotenacibaculum sp. MALMAid0570]|uniref:tetratricopeptide repeat protein n=1 Tax=Pseudotenacibaculum sp. MALMAid0570 TaxID=3143938 RepID=UPI0032E03768
MIKRIVLVIFLGLLYNPFISLGQDSIVLAKDLKEEKQLKFQQYFFKALSEKSIKNYEKAIENLETCNELLPNDVSIYFEFSKNYFLLNKYHAAKEYINKALIQEPNNIWMLSHLVAIYKKERNYKEAIDVQQKIIKLDPQKREDLVRLYYFNRNYLEALSLMDELEKEKGLPRNLKQLKKSLELRKGPAKKKEKQDIKSLIATFEDDQSSFKTLKKILDLAFEEDVKTFHKYSKLAIDLFPAQPHAYLMRGKSLQILSNHKEAISILESGIDFVIDNSNLEADFYETLAKAYDGLGNSIKAQDYRNRAKKLKTVE